MYYIYIHKLSDKISVWSQLFSDPNSPGDIFSSGQEQIGCGSSYQGCVSEVLNLGFISLNPFD